MISNLHRSHERQAPRVALDDKQNPSAQEKVNAFGSSFKGKPKIETFRGTIRGVIRGSGRGVEESDSSYSGPSGITSTSLSASVGDVDSSSPVSIDLSRSALPFRTDAFALGSYTPPAAAGSSKRRFSEMASATSFLIKETEPEPD
ncbi:hypothetical protein POM88_026623 [Heracleum sosnowskyi]|uniref:Uncharacterized protein n=1 Tax=Heracleum sosnowskyi TaxID=360622 RepID=A0AAD8MPF8_9APIA|nr:hypothetical protein POM88_026623 [Heracleum sosnowskyi]